MRFRKLIVLVLLGLVLLFLVLYFLVFNSFYKIVSDSNNITVGFINSSSEVESARSLFGLYLIPRGAQVLSVSTDSSQIRKILDSKALVGINNLDIEIPAQRSVSKIGRQSLSCADKTEANLYYSYDCTNTQGTVFSFANKRAGEFTNKQLPIGLPDNRLSVQSYKNGILSMTAFDKQLSLSYLDIDTNQSITIDTGYSINESVNVRVGSTDNSFTVTNISKSELKYFKDINTEPKVFKLPGNSSYRSCDSTSNKVVCYLYSDTDLGEESKNISNDIASRNGRIVSFSLDNSEQKTENVSGYIDKICSTDEGHFQLYSDGRIGYTKKDNGEVILANKVTDLVCSKSLHTFKTDKDLYFTDGEVSYLAFREPHLVLSNISIENSSILFSAFAGSYRHTYELSTSPLSGKRIESVLPYTLKGNFPVLEMDYDDTSIYIKPVIEITSDHQLGVTTIDEQKLASTKKQIEEKLRKDGLLDTRSIVYFY